MSEFKEKYQKEVIPALKEKFQYKNVMQVPKITKISINRGIGAAVADKKLVDIGVDELTTITGQKAVATKSKKDISNFKLRKGMPIGVKVTLRGEKMYAFLKKLIFFTFSQIRDFRGLSVRSFDKGGNYTLGLKEQLIFPEIEYEDIDQIQGLNITFVIGSYSSKSKTTTVEKLLNGIVLFNFFRFPLNDSGIYNKYSTNNEIILNWERKKSLKRKRWSQD